MTQDSITYISKLGELRMYLEHPQSQNHILILVEGDTDVRLLRSLYNAPTTKIEPIPGGNPKVEEGVNELLDLNFSELIIGIRDADFIHLENTLYNKRNIFLTDLHDMELFLVKNDEVFKNVIHEFFENAEMQYDTIRNKIFEIIEYLSLLKWYSFREGFGLSFYKIGFSHLLNFSTYTFDFQQYFNNLISKSKPISAQYPSILDNIQNLKETNPDNYQVHNGHDYLKALAAFLRFKEVNEMNEKLIASYFRISYTFEHFKNTNLHQQIQNWADQNNCTLHLH